MITLLIILGYILGIFVWMICEKKYNPYEEGEYTIEFDGAHLISEEMHNDSSVLRSILWPYCLSVIIVFFPFVLLTRIFEKL